MPLNHHSLKYPCAERNQEVVKEMIGGGGGGLCGGGGCGGYFWVGGRLSMWVDYGVLVESKRCRMLGWGEGGFQRRGDYGGEGNYGRQRSYYEKGSYGDPYRAGRSRSRRYPKLHKLESNVDFLIDTLCIVS